MSSDSEGFASSYRANTNSVWFDLDDEIPHGVTSKSDKFERLKKNFGLSSEKMESNKKLKSWTSVSKVSKLLDLDSCRTEIFKDRSKLWDSVVKDRMIGKVMTNTDYDTYGREHIHVSDTECDELLTDVRENTRRGRDRFSRERVDLGVRNINMREVGKDGETSPGCSSTSSFSFPVDKKDLDDRSWSRKSSCQGNVSFPDSSNASVNSDALSEKSYGRSVSINSEESVCTEKSVDSSKVCETLPDGTSKTQFENNKSWLSKSTSGSTICEKKVNDSSVTEQNEDMMCDRSKKRTSYIERSVTGSSLQKESTSEKIVSCDKGGTKTVEQKMSSETYKKAYRSPRSTSNYFDKSSANFLRNRVSKNDSRMGHCKTVSEKISKLIDEVVHHDSLFAIPLDLETDIDKMTSDFSDLKSSFTTAKRKNHSRRLGGIISAVENSDLSWSQFKELKAENEALLQENSKLQSIIQDVTAVNKRWQIYNNERRLYVQKLLSTIQDLQEQINLISEKSALQSSHKENIFKDLENLKREFQERKTLLELQIKSHKDDWEAERKEKQKVIREKEDLEKRLKELLKETEFLKSALYENKRTQSLCTACKTTLDRGAVFPRNEFFPSSTFIPGNGHMALHVPYTMLSSENGHFSTHFLPEEASTDGSQSYYSNISKESCFNEGFSESFSQYKKTSGDTIVVEDENGLRLSITEQFPPKDGQMKSILKKTDKKVKRAESKRNGKNRRPSTDDRNPAYEQGCETSFNFESHHASPPPYDVPGVSKHSYSIPNSELLKVTTDSRSKSEPNTRSNSSENLKPLRESSSWNNQCTASSDELAPSECDPSFSACLSSDLVDNYESHHREKNNF